MVIPAAGTGSRLMSALPKLLVPVNGRAMIDHLVKLYASLIDRFIVVVSPAAEASVRGHLADRGVGVDIELQPDPSGMLDAILIPAARVRRYRVSSVWITWCDQVAISRRTTETLAALSSSPTRPALVFPVVTKSEPYIHFERDETGRIVRVLQRREGDPMPAVGEGDVGLFALRNDIYLDALTEYARQTDLGARTRERNFLPFIPWLSAPATVHTFPVGHAMESVGVNTPSELQQVEAYLRHEL